VKKRSRLSAARFLDIEAEVSEEEDEEEEDMRFEDEPAVRHAFANVKSKGDLSIAYPVPGLITVPSDGEMHNVIIRNLDLPASLSWVSVPKKDIRAHLTVRNYPVKKHFDSQPADIGKDHQQLGVHIHPRKSKRLRGRKLHFNDKSVDCRFQRAIYLSARVGCAILITGLFIDFML